MPGRARSQSSHYIPTLDGWRAVAILLVLNLHSPMWKLGPLSTATFKIVDGVQLFFSLSGFLICTRLLREEDAKGSISLKSFYLRRLFRIQPAALTYLAVLSILALAGLIALRWAGVAASVLMVRNLYPKASTALPERYTGHFWSLAVEEHFYLLFPAFLAFVRRRRLTLLFIFLVALEIWRPIVLSHPSLQDPWSFILFRTDMAVDYIMIGCAFAVALQHPHLKLWMHRWLRPWIAVAVSLAILVGIRTHPSQFTRVLVLPIYTLLLVATAQHPLTALGRFLELAPLRFLGRISFSLYLWQQIFLLGAEPSRPWPPHVHAIAMWVGSISCAVASYYLIETPCLRIGHNFIKSRMSLVHTHGRDV